MIVRLENVDIFLKCEKMHS